MVGDPLNKLHTNQAEIIFRARRLALPTVRGYDRARFGRDSRSGCETYNSTPVGTGFQSFSSSG